MASRAGDEGGCHGMKRDAGDEPRRVETECGWARVVGVKSVTGENLTPSFAAVAVSTAAVSDARCPPCLADGVEPMDCGT